MATRNARCKIGKNYLNAENSSWRSSSARPYVATISENLGKAAPRNEVTIGGNQLSSADKGIDGRGICATPSQIMIAADS
jgi:hypothetical protein